MEHSPFGISTINDPLLDISANPDSADEATHTNHTEYRSLQTLEIVNNNNDVEGKSNLTLLSSPHSTTATTTFNTTDVINKTATRRHSGGDGSRLPPCRSQFNPPPHHQADVSPQSLSPTYHTTPSAPLPSSMDSHLLVDMDNNGTYRSLDDQNEERALPTSPLLPPASHNRHLTICLPTEHNHHSPKGSNNNNDTSLLSESSNIRRFRTHSDWSFVYPALGAAAHYRSLDGQQSSSDHQHPPSSSTQVGYRHSGAAIWSNFSDTARLCRLMGTTTGRNQTDHEQQERQNQSFEHSNGPSDTQRSKWRSNPIKLQRKLTVIEIAEGMTKRHLVQTPELMRMVHYHNKASNLEDTMSGSVKLRDLRQVCSFTQSSHRPSIEPRRNCILVNLPQIRCVILHNKILFIPVQTYGYGTDVGSSDLSDPSEECNAVDSVREDSALLEKLRCLTAAKSCAPIEFPALEAVLIEECSYFSSAVTPLTASAKSLMSAIQHEPSKTTRLKDISDLKRRIDSLCDRLRGCQTAIQEVLNNDEDIRRLEISRFWECPTEWENPSDTPASEDAEILLECYEQELESYIKLVTRMDEELDDALQIQQLHLASVRNLLIKSELGLEMVGVSVGIVAAVAGIFGMNVPNGYESKDYIFWPLTQGFMLVVLLTIGVVFFLFRRLQL